MKDDLGLIEYCGEILPITWNDYLTLICDKRDEVEIVKVPATLKSK